ncbi:hypothetical protein D3C85_1476990 [compost metagenome]
MGKGDGFEWRSNAVIPDLGGGDVALFGNDFGDAQATQAPLAGPHAAAAERLGLIGPQATEGDVLADRAGADFFAATDNDFVGGNAVLLLRAV